MKKRLSARQAIIEAAFEVFGRDPSASLAQVADAAGVGRATLHRQFAGRDDLIRALLYQAVREIEDAARKAAAGARSHTEALEAIMTALVALGDRQWFLAQERTADGADEPYREKQEHEFLQLLTEVQKEGLFPERCPVEWAAKVFDHLVYAAWIQVRDGHATPKQAARLAWSTLTAGLKGVCL
ncbi:TetR/AcrR family transcriptional regulator [Hoeflea prorocentri]|uniref:Helix-turn-helix domain containing protein n=1 Tax=Hoeflea prorocentri TaxID=1922333 RepID=A0A9X3UGV3_9HYPH|nr:helix-turn-helix domain-containing protein [Hoeflea prorocentri]MCY6381077.1 helix-turn-helix domain containing protein [Hoeflea prorocentri]MDA5398877.1 helix-turn-helix domain containing protein [Hoeflea prorocentri]